MRITIVGQCVEPIVLLMQPVLYQKGKKGELSNKTNDD